MASAADHGVCPAVGEIEPQTALIHTEASGCGYQPRLLNSGQTGVDHSHDFSVYFPGQSAENKLPAIFPVKNRPAAGAQCSHDNLPRQELEFDPRLFIRVHPRRS